MVLTRELGGTSSCGWGRSHVNVGRGMLVWEGRDPMDGGLILWTGAWLWAWSVRGGVALWAGHGL